jgi:hypothetical protein
MTRAGFAVVLLIGVAAAAGNDEVKKTVPDAREIRKSARALDAEGRKRVEEALGKAISDADAAEPVWELRAVVAEVGGSEPVPVLWTAVTVAGPKGEIRVGVARAADDGVVVGVAILKDGGSPAAGDHAFLKQFESFVLSENLKQPPSKLEEARKAAGLGAVLGATMTQMFKVGMSWERLEALLVKEDVAAKAEAETIAAAFQEVAGHVAKFEHQKEGQRERFAKNLERSRDDVKKLVPLIEAKKFADARQSAGDIAEQCSKCHSGTRTPFRTKREELGIGNGNLVLGVDIAASSDEAKEVQQAVATGVRKALLILAEAK